MPSGERTRPLGAALVRPALAAGGILVLAVALPALHARARSFARAMEFFALERVRVEGTEHVLQAEVLRASSLDAGTSLFDVDPDEVRRNLERHPWIRSAQVRKRWPREIAIRIIERQPRALLRGSGESYLVDRDGTLFERTDAREGEGLPVLAGLGERVLEDSSAWGKSVVLELLGLLEEVQRTRFGREVVEVHRGDGGGVSLVTKEGTVVEMGEIGRATRAISLVERALPALRARFGEPAAVSVMGEETLAVRRAAGSGGGLTGRRGRDAG